MPTLVLAMCTIRALPVLQNTEGFGRGEYYARPTFIRTSVDHGTALELAGRGKADVGSLLRHVSPSK